MFVTWNTKNCNLLTFLEFFLLISKDLIKSWIICHFCSTFFRLLELCMVDLGFGAGFFECLRIFDWKFKGLVILKYLPLLCNFWKSFLPWQIGHFPQRIDFLVGILILKKHSNISPFYIDFWWVSYPDKSAIFSLI